MVEPDFDILLEDGPVLAINKPPGLLTQAPPGIDSLELRVKRFLKAREQKPGNVYLGVPHRLDRPVSGVILLAKHVRAARRLSEQFEARLIRKVYWALCEGAVVDEPASPNVVWTDYLKKLEGEPRSVVVDSTDPEGKIAVLRRRVLARGEFANVDGSTRAATLLEIELETGRTHQIRVQCSHRGHPLIGDEMYGATTTFGPPSIDQRERWIALLARRIEFEHPMTKVRLAIDARPHAAWPDWCVTADGAPSATETST